jgi:TatA/E family protein of Tat protein translocase
MMGFSITEILLIVGIIVLLFGTDKIPDMARKAGKAMRAYRDTTGGLPNLKNPITWVDALTKEKKPAPKDKDSTDKPAP